MNTYTTIQGDTWDLIAFKVYGDEFKAQELMQTRENIELLDYQFFPSGITVHLPVFSEDDETMNDLPAWRRG